MPGLVLGHKLVGQNAIETVGHGAWVQLSDGRALLDFGSYAVPLVGHCHPDIVSSVGAQIASLPISTRTLAHALPAQLAHALAERFRPDRFRRVWFGTNGCDAVELALKLAWARGKGQRVLAVEGAFHGKSLGALAATHARRYRAPFLPLLPPVTHIAVTRAAVARELRSGDVAALIVEPVQGEGGARCLPVDLLREWCLAAREAGVPIIADEIQCGLLRCGAWSLALNWGIEPDAILLGKALGGGVLPISAVLATDDLFDPLLSDPLLHTTTFGGYPAGCAAALAFLEVAGGLARRIDALAQRLDDMLRELQQRHPDVVVSVTGRGLLRGLQFSATALSGVVLTELGRLGLLVSPCLGAPEVIRLTPPAVTSDAELDLAAAMLDEALVEARRFGRSHDELAPGKESRP